MIAAGRRGTPLLSRVTLSVPISLRTAGAVTVGAAILGVLTTASPYAAIAVGAACLALALLSVRILPGLFLVSVVVGLAGFAFLGRGWAYVGTWPVFVGEVGLALALLTITATGVRVRLGVIHGLLLLFMAWGAVRTVPYVARDGPDALRDGVLWAYAAFSFALLFALRGDGLERVVSVYRRFVPAYLIWVPFAIAVSLIGVSWLPSVPGSDVRVVDLKSGDAGVHLTGIAAFVLTGLYRNRANPLSGAMLWIPWLTAIAIACAFSRSALLTGALSMAMLFVLSPSRRWLPLLTVATILACLALLTAPHVNFGRDRGVSVEQLANNTASIVSGKGSDDLEGTEEWRRRWWSEIVSYTFQGQYFWQGKGFGINLADDDGFHSPDAELRSPHNAHMTILARMGVPGLAIWMLLQATFGLAMLRAFFRARTEGNTLWAQTDMWILVYWTAMIVNMTFDVYLEGPQGGIWFWSIFGLGLAALAAQSPGGTGSRSPTQEEPVDARS